MRENPHRSGGLSIVLDRCGLVHSAVHVRDAGVPARALDAATNLGEDLDDLFLVHAVSGVADDGKLAVFVEVDGSPAGSGYCVVHLFPFLVRCLMSLVYGTIHTESSQSTNFFQPLSNRDIPLPSIPGRSGL